MTKAELVSEIAIQTGYDRATITNVLESSMQTVKKTMAKGECVFLRGFGSFIIKTRKEKVARDITKNTSVVVPQHNLPAFKPCSEFIEMVR